MALEINQPLLSHADYLRLPDDLRGEVIDGVFYVTPSPKLRHQQVLNRINVQLVNWLDAHPGLGQAYIAPMDVILHPDLPANVVQPDLMYISTERSAILQDWVRGAPDLIVEVVSPTSIARDTVTKRNKYVAAGVKEYWLVFPEEQAIEVVTGMGQSRLVSVGEGLETPLLPGFTLDTARVFQ